MQMPLFFGVSMHRRTVAFITPFILMATLLAAFALASYAPFLSLDDRGILDFLQSTPTDLLKMFLSGGGDYYRPLTFVSFIFDLQLWGRNAAAFHLVNVALHLCNTLLVYYLASRLVTPPRDSSYAALLAGLLFALHPVNVEAVMWVAGRTDLLCCLFFLLALVLVVETELTKIRAAAGLFLCLLLSLWSKEASIGLFGVVAITWLLHRKEPGDLHRLWLVIASGAATALYLLLRTGLHAKLDSGVAKITAAGGTCEVS